MLVLVSIFDWVGPVGRFLDCHLGDPSLLDAFIDLKTFSELDSRSRTLLARLYDMI